MMNEKFEKYVEIIQKWNKKINLTSNDSIEEIKNHINDSLSLTEFIEDGSRVLDMGSGAGFPGIPIKIQNLTLDITFLDSRRKRASFLDEVIRMLSLENTFAIWGRVEDQEVINKLGFFDCIITRATWKLDEYLQYANLYSRKDAKIIAMKSNQLELQYKSVEEVMHTLGITLWKTKKYKIGNKERFVFVFRKQ